jgi:hypothetical protein
VNCIFTGKQKVVLFLKLMKNKMKLLLSAIVLKEEKKKRKKKRAQKIKSLFSDLHGYKRR